MNNPCRDVVVNSNVPDTKVSYETLKYDDIRKILDEYIRKERGN